MISMRSPGNRVVPGASLISHISIAMSLGEPYNRDNRPGNAPTPWRYGEMTWKKKQKQYGFSVSLQY